MKREVVSKPRKRAEFVLRAERAFARVAIKVREENKRFGLKDAVWPGEKIVR